MKQIPIETILEGGLTPEDFATIFANTAAFDAINFESLNAEMISGLDSTQLANYEEGMDAFAQAADAIQDIFSSEITIYNFVAVITDTLDGLTKLDAAYGLTSGTTSVIRDVLLWVSLVTEKVLFVFENYQGKFIIGLIV